MSEQEVMLDIETLSVRPDAAIVVIGALKFSRTDKIRPMGEMDAFYRRIHIQSCKDVGLRIDKDTLIWWKSQPADIRYEALEDPNRVQLQQALCEFRDWMKPCEKVWGNGDDFDCTILGEAYSKCNLDIPWKFWNTRDCRTLFDLAGMSKDDLPPGNEHHALCDCYRQVVGVRKALKKLELVK